MKCLYAYPWVKLYRAHLPAGKGVMGLYVRLAVRAAYRSGYGRYCGHINEVSAGAWSGGIVGLKSILDIRSREAALNAMDRLQALGYITYSLDPATKKLTYIIKDWVKDCSGDSVCTTSVYATPEYGFIGVPRSITQRLVVARHVFEEADAWMDLWCHTVWGDRHNAFSRLAPIVQFERKAAALTLEELGRRWCWEKTKVWRFFRKYADTFSLCKLPGSYGCLVFNSAYETANGTMDAPSDHDIKRVIAALRFTAVKTHYSGSDHERFNRIVLWYSKHINIGNLNEGCPSPFHPADDGRVAVLTLYYSRAYFSLQQYVSLQEYGCTQQYREPNKPGQSPPVSTGGIFREKQTRPVQQAAGCTLCPAGKQALPAIPRICRDAHQARAVGRRRNSKRYRAQSG